MQSRLEVQSFALTNVKMSIFVCIVYHHVGVSDSTWHSAHSAHTLSTWQIQHLGKRLLLMSLQIKALRWEQAV